MSTAEKNPYRTTFHRDGTVTYWDVYRQQWVHREAPEALSDQILASLPVRERERILRRAAAPERGTR